MPIGTIPWRPRCAEAFPVCIQGLADQASAGTANAPCFIFEIAVGADSGMSAAPDIRARSQTRAPPGARANSFRQGVKNPDKAPFGNVSNVIGRFFFGARPRRAPARADRVIDRYEDFGRRTRWNGDVEPSRYSSAGRDRMSPPIAEGERDNRSSRATRPATRPRRVALQQHHSPLQPGGKCVDAVAARDRRR